jgi:energy-coupling factor transporter ATP-binding protein EcfA2
VFKHLQLAGWRQFQQVDIELHPRLTVLTGANGAGKTTLLNIFAQHFGWSSQYLATPQQTDKGIYKYVTGILEKLLEAARAASRPVQVGSIKYLDGSSAKLRLPVETGIQYTLDFEGMQGVPGLHVGSHSEMPHYQRVASIPSNVIEPQQAYDIYNQVVIQHHQGSYPQYSTTYRLKEALISMATFGAGNEYVQKHPAALSAYIGFIEVLKKVIPPSIGFLNLSIRTPDVVLITESGEFLIDAASGGVLTLIDLAWRIYMYSVGKANFVVTIDEPENHLHPSMQRLLLPSFLKAFPSVQFIVATHSPFMVSAVKDSNVYALQFRDREGRASAKEPPDPSVKRAVISIKLDTINKASDAAHILREVLGVEATVPEWVEADVAAIVDKYRDKQLTETLLNELRNDLKNLGYSDLYPAAVSRLVPSK